MTYEKPYSTVNAKKDELTNYILECSKDGVHLGVESRDFETNACGSTYLIDVFLKKKDDKIYLSSGPYYIEHGERETVRDGEDYNLESIIKNNGLEKLIIDEKSNSSLKYLKNNDSTVLGYGSLGKTKLDYVKNFLNTGRSLIETSDLDVSYFTDCAMKSIYGEIKDSDELRKLRSDEKKVASQFNDKIFETLNIPKEERDMYDPQELAKTNNLHEYILN